MSKVMKFFEGITPFILIGVLAALVVAAFVLSHKARKQQMHYIAEKVQQPDKSEQVIVVLVQCVNDKKRVIPKKPEPPLFAKSYWL